MTKEAEDAMFDELEASQAETDAEPICPDCDKPLTACWYGQLACFCLWGGKEPTLEQLEARKQSRALLRLQTREKQLERFRDAVLNERFQLEEGTLTPDQINQVLALFDDQFGPVGKVTLFE